MLLDLGAPGKVRLPVGQEHGRTIPLADVAEIPVEDTGYGFPLDRGILATADLSELDPR